MDNTLHDLTIGYAIMVQKEAQACQQRDAALAKVTELEAVLATRPPAKDPDADPA